MDRYEEEKKLAAQEAVKYVENDMLLGVGSGSTIKYFIEYLAERVREGLQVQVVPTSKETGQLCQTAGIALYKGEAVPERIDLTIDGADEFDSQLNLVKGGGGDLLWEKIVASVSEREIIVVDSRKKVCTLGEKFLLPVEVIPYASLSVQQKLEQLSVGSKIRMAGEEKKFVIDEGNYILDCQTGGIRDVCTLSAALSSMTGVVEHGLFVGLTDMVIEAEQGRINKYEAKNPIITPKTQKSAFEEIDKKIEECRGKGEVPVIELDLDLTTFIPMERTVLALKHAGEKYEIPEFTNPVFDLLPGYTREAWTNFISRSRLIEKYPSLRWLGEKDGKDGDSVYSAFHTYFWRTELLELDTLAAGLPEYIRRVQAKGAVVVFVSGRWKEEQIEPTLAVLKKGKIEDVPTMRKRQE